MAPSPEMHDGGDFCIQRGENFPNFTLSKFLRVFLSLNANMYLGQAS